MVNLLEENKRILKNFEKNGVNLSNKLEFDFRISLANKETCIKVRQLFRDKFGVPKDGLFGIISDPEDYQLSLAISLMPTAEIITEIESKLLDVSKDYDDAEVFWEFRE